MHWKIIATILCLVMPGGIGSAQDKVSSVEGKWERHQKNDGGKSFRFVKVHTAGRTILTTYDEKGEVVSQHTSEYKLRKTDEVLVFTYSNIEITAGPNKGQKSAGPFSFAYRVQNGTFHEFSGVLLGDAATPILIVWTRVKEG